MDRGETIHASHPYKRIEITRALNMPIILSLTETCLAFHILSTIVIHFNFIFIGSKMHWVVFDPPQSFYFFCAKIKYIGSTMTHLSLIIEKNTLGRMMFNKLISI